MKWRCVLAFVLLTNGPASQTVDSRKWNTVEILCGKLLRSGEIPVKGKANVFTDRTKPIKDAIIRLYRRNEETACCDGQQKIAEATSNRAGHFEFKSVVPGAYWIVAEVNGKSYKLAIIYKPDNKNDAKCSDILYAVKKDQLELQRVITVD